MGLSKQALLSVATCVIGALSALDASAVTLNQTFTGSFPGSVSGTLPDQGSVLELAVTLPTAGNFSAYTTSYATGGFEGTLMLYDSTGVTETPTQQGFASSAATDPTTGQALDASLDVDGLAAGTYTLTLTDFNLSQSLTATNLSDGFTDNSGNGTTFVDEYGNTRTGAYTLDFNATSAASAVPEPGGWTVSLLPLAAGFLLLRKRRATSIY